MLRLFFHKLSDMDPVVNLKSPDWDFGPDYETETEAAQLGFHFVQVKSFKSYHCKGPV